MNAMPGFPLDFADLKAGQSAPLPRNIKWMVYRDDDKFARLVPLLDAVGGPSVIFVNTPRESGELNERLLAEGFSSESCLPSLSAPERDRLNALLTEGSIQAIIATHECLDTITHPKLALVARYVLPSRLDWMLAEGKLAGQAGNDAYAALFFSREDRNEMELRLRARHPSSKELTRVRRLLEERRRKNFGTAKPGNLVIPLERIAPRLYKNREAEYCEGVLSVLAEHRLIRSFTLDPDKRNACISLSAGEGRPVPYAEIETEWKKAYVELDKVEEYAFAPQCRLFALLSILLLPVPEPNCGRCDLCMEREMQWRLQKYDEEFARSVIEAVAELREKFGRNTVIDVLRGKNTKNIRAYNLKGATSFGSMAGKERKQLAAIIDGLIEDGFLSVRRGLYPTLELTYWGRNALRDRHIEEVVLPRLTDKSLPEKYNSELYETLRTVRKRLAKFNNVPTFQILSDKALQQMAIHAPANLEELKSVSGVGDTRIQKFGPAFIAAISRFRHKGQFVLF